MHSLVFVTPMTIRSKIFSSFVYFPVGQSFVYLFESMYTFICVPGHLYSSPGGGFLLHMRMQMLIIYIYIYYIHVSSTVLAPYLDT